MREVIVRPHISEVGVPSPVKSIDLSFLISGTNIGNVLDKFSINSVDGHAAMLEVIDGEDLLFDFLYENALGFE